MADVNVTPFETGEQLAIGPTRIRVLEDGSRTDNRIGVIASMMPAGIAGPPEHRHLMHDETFLITNGSLQFTLGACDRHTSVGDYIVVPVGAPHTFANVSDAPVEFLTTFTPAFYVNYFRELAALSAKGEPSREASLALMRRYATEPC